MIKMIAGVSTNSIIGLTKDKPIIPWYYPEDLQFFKRMTSNSIIIMGRNTFESMGNKCLPKRRNIIISPSMYKGEPSTYFDVKMNTAEIYPSLKVAIDCCNKEIDGIKDPRDIWLIGGTSIYQEGLNYADEIYITMIPDMVDTTDTTSIAYFPYISPLRFKQEHFEELLLNSDKPNLHVMKYSKI